MNKNGIGPQGLGKKSHNGFWIGSPAKQLKSNYSEATNKFKNFDTVNDTVTVRRGPTLERVMQSTDDENYLRFRGDKPAETKYFKNEDNSYSAYNLRKKPPTAPGKKLEDLSGDGRVTQKDVLIAKGVIKAPKSPTKKTVKDACYKKVKATYDVFPSAYASGAIAKCRKNKK